MSPSVLARAWFGGAGVLVGLAGAGLDRRWLVWVGLGLVAIAFLLRFAERGHHGR